jgi:hypothetical protein
MWQSLAVFMDPPVKVPTGKDSFLDTDHKGGVDPYGEQVFQEVRRMTTLADTSRARPKYHDE